MKTRIADELRRTDKDTAIANAIASAIQHFKDEGFVECERRKEYTLVVDQRTYAIPSDFVSERSTVIQYESTIQPMQRTTIEVIDNLDTNAADPESTRPYLYAFWTDNDTGARSMDIWPRSQDASYKIYQRYIANLAAPASDTTTGNFWMVEGEALIRRYSKAIIFADVLRQYDKAKEEEALAQTEYSRLRARTEAMHLQGVEVRPWL